MDVEIILWWVCKTRVIQFAVALWRNQLDISNTCCIGLPAFYLEVSGPFLGLLKPNSLYKVAQPLSAWNVNCIIFIYSGELPYRWSGLSKWDTCIYLMLTLLYFVYSTEIREKGVFVSMCNRTVMVYACTCSTVHHTDKEPHPDLCYIYMKGLALSRFVEMTMSSMT